jgi:hypothetical protein
MNDFIRKYEQDLNGTLSGFDRLVFLGTLWRNRLSGLKGYLWSHGMGAKDFGAHAEKISKRVKAAAVAEFEAAGRPVLYLNSGRDDKQKIALEIAAQDGIRQGPICALSAVELCSTYRVGRGAAGPELQIAPRKCLFLYQYWMHPVFGFMSVRLQSWFPFPIHIYMNGRQWLTRQMDAAGLRYDRQGNCFPWIEDLKRAQHLMDGQRRVHWAELFDQMAARIHPLLFSELAQDYPMRYYWTCAESEWATDFVFRDPAQLRRMVPLLMRLGVISLSSTDILRFMGKKVTPQGEPFGGFWLPNNSDLKVRTVGARIKHRLGPNSIKLYDKAYTDQGAVLRAEVTISVPRFFKILRRTDDPQSRPALRPMRQSIADLDARARTSQAILDRYTHALAAIDDSTTLEELTARIERRVRWKGRCIRAIHPFEPDDRALLSAVNRGEFTIAGFRNQDLQSLLYQSQPKNLVEKKRRSAAISRKLRMLRAHGLIRKRPRSHRYDVTKPGRKIIEAILLAQKITVNKLLPLAA